jgi:pimeloyl-ACP methyl ester carboxylesterase
MLPHAIRRSLISMQFWSMFHDRDAIDPAVGDLVVDEFRRIYHSAGARYAFWTAARNIYLEPPFGRHGFYPRLAGLRPPALWMWGSHDPLIPPAFGRHVAKWLPEARQVTIDRCGHVPQVERPDQINDLLVSFFNEAERSGLVPSRRSRADIRAA